MEHISKDINLELKKFIRQPMGISTGFSGLDASIWGLQPGQLIVVGGRSSMGKTSFLADVALAASKEAPIGIFSFDMSKDRLQRRMAANLADLNFLKIRKGEITDAQRDDFLSAGQEIKNLPIYIEDKKPGYIGIDQYWLKQRKLSIEQTIDYKIKHLLKEHGCKVIFIDYLQLITHVDASVKDLRITVGRVAEKLRDYAKQYNFCCILMCQLRRFNPSQYTGNKIPMPKMDDLKESGEIENHSDVVILLHRPEYYNEKRIIDLDANVVEDNALLMVAKNNDGPTGNIHVEWRGYSMSYRDFKRNNRDF